VFEPGYFKIFRPLVYTAYNNYTSIVSTTLTNCAGGGANIASDEIEIVDNNISDVENFGIHVRFSVNAIISKNTVENVGWSTRGDGYGIAIGNSANIKLSHNKIANVTQYGIYWRSKSPEAGFIEFENNTLNGEPIHLLQDQKALTVINESVQLIINNCSDITVRGMEGNGIIAGFVKVLTIEDCNFSYGGITVFHSPHAVIRDNVVTLLDTGTELETSVTSGAGCIHVSGSDYITMQNNTIMNSGMTHDGIRVEGSRGIKIHQNSVDRAGREGILLIQSKECEITKNTVTDAFLGGIQVRLSPDCEIIENNMNHIGRGVTLQSVFFDEPRFNGICVFESEDCVLVENEIHSTLANGLFLLASSGATLIRNTINDAGLDGIRLEAAGAAYLVDNSITNTRRHGVALNSAPDVIVTGTNVTDADGFGYHWMDAYYWFERNPSFRILRFENNTLNAKAVTVFQNQESPVLDSDITEAIIINCTGVIVEKMIGNGIMASYSPRITIRFSEFTGGGISLSHCDYAIIAANAITKTPSFVSVDIWETTFWGSGGIQVYGCNNSIIVGNTITNIGLDGIVVLDSDDTHITGNTICNSEGSGIYLESTKRTTISGNIINHTAFHTMVIDYSSELLVYLNAFGQTGLDHICVQDVHSVLWDNGSLGNYWQGYVSIDDDQDGVFDIPYEIEGVDVINEGFQIDEFPLTSTSFVNHHRETFLTLCSSVTAVKITPTSPTDLDSITITVTLSAPSGITNVILSYSTNDSAVWTNATMIPSANNWTATIQPMSGRIIVECRIYAQDGFGTWVMFSIDPIEVYQSPETTPTGFDIGLLIAVGSGVGVVIIFVWIAVKKK
jgi:parallel beta-helix repeat protein